MTRIYATDLVGGILVAVGILAFATIDPAGGRIGGDTCQAFERDEARCQPEPWRDPAVVQQLLVLGGFLGLALVAWGFIRRQTDDRP